MGILKTLGAFAQASLFGGTFDDLAFELRVTKQEVQGLHQRLDTELSDLRDRIDVLEGKPGRGKGRSRLSIVSSADLADPPPKAEAAAGLTSSNEGEQRSPSGGPAAAELGLNSVGGGAFSKDMTIAQALALHPEAEDVLSRHHLPACGHCAVSRLETVEDGLVGHGLDAELVLAELNRLVWN